LFGLVWLISRTFSANEQYFSLIPNQPTVFSAMAYQPNKPKQTGRITVVELEDDHDSIEAGLGETQANLITVLINTLSVLNCKMS